MSGDGDPRRIHQHRDVRSADVSNARLAWNFVLKNGARSSHAWLGVVCAPKFCRTSFESFSLRATPPSFLVGVHLVCLGSTRSCFETPSSFSNITMTEVAQQQHLEEHQYGAEAEDEVEVRRALALP